MSHDQHARPGILPRLLAWVTRLVIARPVVSLCVIAVSCCVCLGWSALHLTFKTKRSDLIDHRADFHQRWLKFAEEFGESSDVIVVVESPSPEAIRTALDDLGQRIEQESEFFTRVQWKFDPSVLRSRGLQFLPPAVLQQAVVHLRDYSPILKSGRWDVIGLDTIGDRLSFHLGDSISQHDAPATGRGLKQIARLAHSLAGFVENPLDFVSPWPEVIPANAGGELAQMKVHYNLNDRETMGFILVVPTQTESDFSGGAPAIQRLREIIHDRQSAHTNTQLGLTGIPILEADEMAKSQQDMTNASVISFVGVAVLMIMGFRGIRHPLIAQIMLVIGMCWSMGFITVAIGHLNILSVSFATILIGIGVDFAIHFMERYLDYRHAGSSLSEALIQTSLTTGAGIVTCALSTSMAFFCAGVTSFLGVSELGIIAGGGVLLCAMAAFLVLPPLICVADGRLSGSKLPHATTGKVIQAISHRIPGTIVTLSLMGIILVTGCGIGSHNGHYISRVKYDANLLNLQARGVPSVELQHRIFEQSNGSLLYAVSVARSPSEILRMREQFLRLPTVGRVEEIASLLPRYPEAQTQVYLAQLHEMLLHVTNPPTTRKPLNQQKVTDGLEKLLTRVEALPDTDAQSAAEDLNFILDTLAAIPPENQSELLNGYQTAMDLALSTQLHLLSKVTDLSPVTEALPSALLSRFVSPRGNWLIRVYPKQQIWDEGPLSEFVHDVRTVDPEATGTPLQNFEAARQIRESYEHAAVLACGMVVFVLLVDMLSMTKLVVTTTLPLIVVALTWTLPALRSSIGFLGLALIYFLLVFAVAAILDIKSLGKSLLVMLPPVAGGLLTFGTLALMKTDLNPANMIVLPLLLGIGVDCGIFIVHDYMAQAPGTYQLSTTIVNAILMTSTTTMVGFGSMLISSHYGLASLGLVLTIGVGHCLFISLFPLPAVLTLLDRFRVSQSDSPVANH